MPKLSKVEKLSDKDFAEIVAKSSTIKEVSEALGYSSSRSARKRTSARIERMGLNTKHFRNWVQYGMVPTIELLVKNSSINNQTVKKRVLKEGLLKNECSECGNKGFHNGLPLVLHMDHVDGDKTNNELINLRMLCPNCHSQTKTFGGRNIRFQKMNS